MFPCILQVKNEFEIFAKDDRKGRLMMVVTSPRVNSSVAGDRVVTLAQQARSMMMARCESVISIVVSGSGITAYGRIPTLVPADQLAKLETAAKLYKMAKAGQNMIFCLVMKKVNILIFVDFL